MAAIALVVVTPVAVGIVTWGMPIACAEGGNGKDVAQKRCWLQASQCYGHKMKEWYLGEYATNAT